MHTQFERACEIIMSEPAFADETKEVILIGTSLGGLIARAVLQGCPIGERVREGARD